MRTLKIAILFLIITLNGSFSIQAQTMTLEETRSFFLKVLENEGVKGWIDSDGDVQFTYNDHEYYFWTDGFGKFLSINRFDVWEIENEEERANAYRACSIISKDSRITKAYVKNDYVWFSIELFLTDMKDLDVLFFDCIELLEAAHENLISEM
ncbi:MAG: hypothetical protein AB8B56_19750 [Crocinitomicaceae bacterium]